jgi:hypothetical protein
VAREKTPKRAAAAGNPSLPHCPQIRRIRYGHGAPPQTESHAKTLPIPGLWESPDSKPSGPALATVCTAENSDFFVLE